MKRFLPIILMSFGLYGAGTESVFDDGSVVGFPSDMGFVPVADLGGSFGIGDLMDAYKDWAEDKRDIDKFSRLREVFIAIAGRHNLAEMEQILVLLGHNNYRDILEHDLGSKFDMLDSVASRFESEYSAASLGDTDTESVFDDGSVVGFPSDMVFVPAPDLSGAFGVDDLMDAYKDWAEDKSDDYKLNRLREIWGAIAARSNLAEMEQILMLLGHNNYRDILENDLGSKVDMFDSIYNRFESEYSAASLTDADLILDELPAVPVARPVSAESTDLLGLDESFTMSDSAPVGGSFNPDLFGLDMSPAMPVTVPAPPVPAMPVADVPDYISMMGLDTADELSTTNTSGVGSAGTSIAGESGVSAVTASGSQASTDGGINEASLSPSDLRGEGNSQYADEGSESSIDLSDYDSIRSDADDSYDYLDAAKSAVPVMGGNAQQLSSVSDDLIDFGTGSFNPHLRDQGKGITDDNVNWDNLY